MKIRAEDLMEEAEKAALDFLYVETTEEIRVSVVCQPLLASSDPARNVFAFSYSITIENLSSLGVQLLERHWVIKSNGRQIAEVVGPGVVGEQPVMEPGDTFQYTSGAVIQDPVGSMEGSYTFRTQEGRFFQVAIPRFELTYPVVIH